MGGHAEMRYFFLIICSILNFNASAYTIYAGAKRTHKNIRSAIIAATNGDTILVDSGIYNELNLIINKSIILHKKKWAI